MSMLTKHPSDTALQRQRGPTKARPFSPGYLAAAGARNFNIRRGSSELAITESRGGIDPPQRRVVDGRQHMLSLSLIKFL